MRKLLLAVVAPLAVACADPASAPTTEAPGLQYQGSIVVHPGDDQRIELSAPLFPDATVFEHFQNEKAYPALTPAERVALVTDDVKTYEALLGLCAPTHPAITVQAPGAAALTADEIAANYDAVGLCAYEEYGAKPYWVPQHVSDVDICGIALGAGFRLPTEADVDAMTESDFAFFQSTLTLQPGADQFPTYFYYTLDLYVRGADGTIKLGNLAPQTDHVGPLPVTGSALHALYVGDERQIGVRCVRTGAVTP